MSAATPVPQVGADGALRYGDLVVERWPSLRASTRPPEDLVREILRALPGSPLWPFAARIPQRLLQSARLAPTDGWGLLELAAAAPERGCELISLCPALALLLVRSCPKACDDRAAYFRGYLDLTWRQMLGRLGLPPQRRLVRILRKMPLLHCGTEALEDLVNAIADQHPFIRVLSHLPRITRDTAALLEAPRRHVSPKLLLDSAKSEYDEKPVFWSVDAVSWFSEGEYPGRPWPYGQLDAAALARVEARFRDRFGEEGEYLAPFPEPPVSGIPGRITAIRSYWFLSAEGDEQNNCAETLAPEIVAGRCYVYSVTAFERATLALRRDEKTGRWFIEDLRARDNAAVSQATTAYVRAWLIQMQPIGSGTEKCHD